MDESSPLRPATSEILISALLLAIILAVAVASYRRSRCLSGYPVWKSLIIGAVACLFWELWLILWYVNRKSIAGEWSGYRQAKRPALAG